MIALSDVVLVVATSALTMAAVLALVWLAAPKRVSIADAKQLAYGEILLKFEDGICVKASPSALDLLEKRAPEDVEFGPTCDILSRRFDALSLLLEAQSANGWTELKESIPSSLGSDQAKLHLEYNQQSCSFHVADPAVPNSADRHRAMVGKARFKHLYETLNKVPFPIWFSDDSSHMVWANRSYKSLLRPKNEQAPVFEFDSSLALNGNGDRVSITDPLQSDRTHWYDVSMIDINRGNKLNYATNIDGIIAAETAQRKFVQTLAKTFAQLSIGLAIFDRERKLVLFNPALVDLTSLPPQFLSVRPNMQSFFDKLRDNRIMPEPKDYASWRKQIADLVVKAADGDYQETWGLPSGLTYRVSGRPHPDGAIAILIEDISAEISLTRRFKGQIELGNRALETLADAIIVLGPEGTVAFWNAAFRKFCSLPDNAQASDYDLLDIIKLCSKKFPSSPELEKLKEALRNPREQISYKGRIPLKDEPPLSFDVRTHDGSATIVSLHTSEQPKRVAFPELTSTG